MKVLPPPGPERSSQVTRLVILLLILAGVLWYWSRPAGSPATASNQARATTPPASGTLPVPEPIRTDALSHDSGPPEVTRNPFVFSERQAASDPGSSYLTPPDALAPGPPAPLAPREPQGPPPIPLRLTGLSVVTAGGPTLVTLKDPSTNVLYQAFEGDIVDGRYRVVKVGVQSVVVSYLDGSGMRTLALGG